MEAVECLVHLSLLNKFYIRHEELADEEIVQLAQEGEQFAVEYLVDKYKNFMRAKAGLTSL